MLRFFACNRLGVSLTLPGLFLYRLSNSVIIINIAISKNIQSRVKPDR